MNQSKEFEGWVSVKEASELTGYSTEYIRELAREAAITATKVGFAVLINLKSLQDYKDKKTQVN